MAWPKPGVMGTNDGLFGVQAGAGSVEMIDEDFVQPKVAIERETIDPLRGTMKCACGPRLTLLFTLEPVCWMFVVASPRLPSLRIGNAATLPPP